MSAAEAIRTVRMHRDIHPNEGFIQQLADLDNELKRDRLYYWLRFNEFQPPSRDFFWGKPFTHDFLFYPPKKGEDINGNNVTNFNPLYNGCSYKTM